MKGDAVFTEHKSCIFYSFVTGTSVVIKEPALRLEPLPGLLIFKEGLKITILL